MRKLGSGLVFVVGAAVVAVDQVTKAAVARSLPLQVPWAPIESLSGVFSLTYVTNTGAAFGLFPQLGNVYVVVALAVVAALLIFYRQFAVTSRLMQVCLGLQVGGAIGNLIDRLRLGYVVDFLDFKFWPVFNVADSCIVVGVVILAFLLLRQPAREVSPRVSETPPSQT
ncbi:MAG: signal peptidase II [Anaerolineae bacterium]